MMTSAVPPAMSLKTTNRSPSGELFALSAQSDPRISSALIRCGVGVSSPATWFAFCSASLTLNYLTTDIDTSIPQAIILRLSLNFSILMLRMAFFSQNTSRSRNTSRGVNYRL